VDAHRAWTEIDLDALAHNLGRIRARIHPASAIVLVVKADAYGHGAVAIAHRALACGVEALGVGTSAEALELRAAGILAPVLVLGTIVDEEASLCLRHGVHIALHSQDRARMLAELAGRLNTRARVHLKVDTGMGRLGVRPERALDLLRAIHQSEHMDLCGVMTHVAATEGAECPSAIEQIAQFDALLRRARSEGLELGRVHAANSACVFTNLGVNYGAVRPGLSAYGILPGGLPGADELRPVLSLHSQIVFLKDLPQGAAVGYASTWRAGRTTRVATLPIGYNDGLCWRLGNQGEVLVRGQRAPIIGRVSMDYTTLDVTHIPGVEVGDRVTVIGTQGDQSIDLEELAERAGTVPYEIACTVGRRVARIYRGGEQPIFAAVAPRAEPGIPRVATPPARQRVETVPILPADSTRGGR
jgi:alanine racemase